MLGADCASTLIPKTNSLTELELEEVLGNEEVKLSEVMSDMFKDNATKQSSKKQFQTATNFENDFLYPNEDHLLSQGCPSPSTAELLRILQSPIDFDHDPKPFPVENFPKFLSSTKNIIEAEHSRQMEKKTGSDHRSIVHFPSLFLDFTEKVQ